MLRAGIQLLLAIFLASSCYGTKLDRAGIKSDARSGENAPESVDTAVLPSSENADPKPEAEKALPPANISGSYLLCELVKPVMAADTEANVQCALKDEVSNNKIDLTARFASYKWTYTQGTTDSLAVTFTELTNNPDWHVNYLVKPTVAGDLATKVLALDVSLTVKDSAGVISETSSTPVLSMMQWMALDGASVPALAPVAGTWNNATANLYICRLYNGNEVLPGKLLTHFNDPNKSICYSTTPAGASVQSQSDDAQTQLVKNDVLVIPEGTFADYFEWVSAINGQYPANAFVTGQDAQGRALYTCRGIQMDGMIAEQTPGVLRPGSTGCVHENKLLAELRSSYQVLTWKSTGTTRIQSGRGGRNRFN